MPQETPGIFTKIGKATLYFGPLNSNARIALNRFSGDIILEPGHTAKDPVGALLGNRIAYLSSNGINQQNIALLQTFAQFAQNIPNLQLKDSSGHTVDDPLGPGTHMLDLRKPEVKTLLTKVALSYVDGKNPQTKKYEGIFLDALESAIALENGNPNFYKGLVRANVASIQDIAKNIKLSNPNNRVIVNGGLVRYAGKEATFDALATIAKDPNIDGICVERQFSADRNGEDSRSYTLDRVGTAIRAALNAGKKRFSILALEADSFDITADQQAAAAFWQQLLAPLQATTRTKGAHIEIYPVCCENYTSYASITEQAEVAIA